MFSSRDLTIQQLRCFVAVADEGQFTAAADELNVAQPSISAQINRLEHVLGVTLFHRGRRPIALTDAGQQLVPLARRVLAGIDDVFSEAEDLEGLRRGHVTIGTTPSIGATLLPPLLAAFRRRYPGVAVSFVERHSREIATALEMGDLDLALMVGPIAHPNLAISTLAHEHLIVIVGRDHPLATHQTVRLSDLANVPLIYFHEGYDVRTTTESAFAAAGLHPSVALEGAEIGTVHAFVAAGLGAAIVPGLVAAMSDDVVALDLVDPTIERTVCVAYDQRHSLSRAATALLEAVRDETVNGDWAARTPGLRIVVPPPSG